MSEIVYARDPAITVDEYIAVVGGSSLGPTRPIRDRERVGRMLAGAGLIVTARHDGECIGLARCLTDFAWVSYCSDLAVREDFQRQGIGSALLKTCKETLGDEVSLILLSVPDAVGYYERIGMHRSHDAFFIPRSRGA